MIRSFEPTDVIKLHRLRKQGVTLDNRTVLTWGTRAVTMRALFSPFSEATGVFTGLQNGGNLDNPLIGQASHLYGADIARLTYLAPESAIELPAVDELIDYLIQRIGEREAKTLLAEVDENSAAFEILRLLNFSIYARQQIWRISTLPKQPLPKSNWRRCGSLDVINIRKLYSASVPTLVTQIEAKDCSEMNGWVLYQDHDLLGFAEIAAGPIGVWMQLFCHPEMEKVEDHLANLLALLRPRARRPVYLCLRRYQTDLSAFLTDIGAESSAGQAVMARRLAALVTHAELSPLPKINGTTEATTPYNDFSEFQG